MSISIENSIRKTVLASVFITFITTVIAVLIANESLEKTLLELDFQAEYNLILENAKLDEIMVWDNEHIKAYYLPDNLYSNDKLPDVFRNIEPPYSNEIEINGSTFLVTSSKIKEGKFYLAKDITIFEKREQYFHIFLVFLGLSITLISLILVKLASERLAAPIRKLTTEIANTKPKKNIYHIDTKYSEYELQEIAKSFNIFLDELESYIKREQSLMGLASHELRTPIAVMVSSMDVIEKRDGATLRSKGAFIRMRNAAKEMSANIDMILKLSRRQSDLEKFVAIDIADLIDGIKGELYTENTDYIGRVDVEIEHKLVLNQDPYMVKMLLRNLMQNALNHTQGKILIVLSSNHIEIRDFGLGLPDEYKEYINNSQNSLEKLNSLSGLGLFIVLLICDRIAWSIKAVSNNSKGTSIVIEIDGDSTYN